MTVKQLCDILATEVERNSDAIICDTAGVPILAVVNKGDKGILTLEPKDQWDMDAIIHDIAEDYKDVSCNDGDVIADFQDAGVNLSDLEEYDAANDTAFAEYCRINAPKYGLEDCWLKDCYDD